MLLCIIFSLLFLHGSSTEFEVGDAKGWEVPPSKEPRLYSDWAQRNRFILNDTIHFSYKKDSIMVVANDTEYDKCHSSRPLFFGNNGDTKITLDRPGLFYFISGVAGHCERGQRMIVKVLNVESPPINDDQHPNPNDNKNKKSGATHLVMFMGFNSFSSLMLLIVVGFDLMKL